MIKLRFDSDNFILADKVEVNPSPVGGSGFVILRELETIWAGRTHLFSDNISLQSSSITAVETRSNLHESDEPWVDVWQRERSWCYEDDHEVERLLTTLQGSD